MKKVLIVMIVAAMAVAACGKKAAPVTPATGSGQTMPATGSGDGSAPAPTGDAPPPAM